MSAIIERAKLHFKDKLSKVGSIEVPEWGEDGKPLIVYWRAMNLKERDQIFKYLAKQSLEGFVEALILRARDEDGKRLFGNVHKTELMRHVDPEVIERIINAMNDPESLDSMLEDAEKN